MLPHPMVLGASDLAEEIAFARSFADLDLEEHPSHRCCIAIAGFTLLEVQLFAHRVGLPVLDGSHDPTVSGLVLSDLEQTKGYEFNIMLIVNCREGVLPPDDAPEEEAFRHGCLLYVAMTRARDELYLFSSGPVSQWLRKAEGDLHFDLAADVMPLNHEYLSNSPIKMSQSTEQEGKDNNHITGWDYAHTPSALKLSAEALAKLVELVDGTSVRRGDYVQKWRTVKEFKKALEISERTRAMAGPRVQRELRDRLLDL
jgi:hypothetical protein